MKNKGVILSLIIVLLIVIIGLIVFLSMTINGNFHVGSFGAKKSEQVIYDESYTMSEINHLEILSSSGDVTFSESTDGQIRVVVYGKDAEELETSLNDGKWRIDYSKYKNKSVSFGWNFYMNDINVYLPKEYANHISLNTNYGNVEVIDLENATMEIESDCGNVTLGKIKDISVDSDYGDVKIETVLEKLSIKSSCGDVKINSIAITQNSEIESDFGDVKIGETNDIFIQAKTDLGDVKVNNNNRYGDVVLKIENDCGDIKVEN